MTARTQALNMLRAVARKDAGGRIAHQFATDPGRMERMGVEAAGLYLDLSKQAWSAEGFEAALDQQRFQGAAVKAENGAIDRNRGMFIFIGIHSVIITL